MTVVADWYKHIGHQRDWVWRGWQVRYSYLRSSVAPAQSYPPILLIHGFGAAIEHWRKNMGVLSENHSVYAIDLLGFGASRKPYTDFSVDLWLQQVYDFWQTFIRQPVILISNSTGSLVALAMAAHYPEAVKGLVMLNLPDLSLRQTMIPKALQPLVNTVERLFSSPLIIHPLFNFLRRPQVIRLWAKWVAYYDPHAVNDELVAILAIPPQDEGAARTFLALTQSVKRPQFSPPVRSILPTLSLPILLVWGRQDRMIPFKFAPLLADLNPKIEFFPIESIGHCPHDEDPDRVNPILLNWITQHFGELAPN